MEINNCFIQNTSDAKLEEKEMSRYYMSDDNSDKLYSINHWGRHGFLCKTSYN